VPPVEVEIPGPRVATGQAGAVTIRVLVADDQEMVRAGFRMILDAHDDLEVVGEAGDGRTAVELARRLRPDVCLLDIRMPELDGLEATRLLAGPEVAEPIPVVVVTTFDLDDYVHRALRNGASGFLLKDAGPVLLVEAVRAAARGDALVSPSVTVRLLQHFAAAGAAPSSARAQPIEPLTEREEEVLRAVALGRTNAELADELYISLSTVKSHLATLMTKLGARNRVELAAWAWQTGRMR
jgi:DNA-binding NarL/FixJ family response regulator